MKYDRVKFEEMKWPDLIDKFIDRNPNVWAKFVDDEYQLYEEQYEN